MRESMMIDRVANKNYMDQRTEISILRPNLGGEKCQEDAKIFG